jgi:nucleotidyltransferase substrate binding protein (TIGR01987 family)
MTEPGLDLTALRNATASLEDAVSVVSDTTWFNQQSDKVQHTLVAGVIQNFEFVYDVSVKMIKRSIEQQSLNPTEVDRASFRDILRMAAERGLIEDVEAWFHYRSMRDMTAYTYDHAKAQDVYRDTMTCVGSARSLLARLEEQNG